MVQLNPGGTSTMQQQPDSSSRQDTPSVSERRPPPSSRVPASDVVGVSSLAHVSGYLWQQTGPGEQQAEAGDSQLGEHQPRGAFTYLDVIAGTSAFGEQAESRGGITALYTGR